MIAELLTDAYADLRDKLIVNFASWFKEEHTFSLSDGEGNNTLDLADVPYFQMAQGLDLLSGSQSFTVEQMDSFASRNQGNGLWPLGVGMSFSGVVGRRYWVDGTTLTVYPPQNASGNYRLIYTPMLLPLATPTLPPPHVVSLNTGSVQVAGLWAFPSAAFNDSDIGATFTVTGATNPGNNGAHVITAVGNSTTVYTATTGLVNETFGVGASASIQPTSDSTRTFNAAGADVYVGAQRSWIIAAGAFTSSDVGANLTVTLPSPNEAFNGQYKISTVLSSTAVIVESTNVGSLFMTTTVVDAFTVNRSQLGTISELPQPLTPWSNYLVLHASLAIRTSRQQQTAGLDLQFTQIERRVIALTKQRSEGVRQAPSTRRWGGWT